MAMRQKQDKSKGQKGFTFIEILIGIAVFGIIIVALTMFVGRAFNVSREQFEQVRITEDARLQIDRLTTTIRNARYVDCDGDSYSDQSWLLEAQDNQIKIITSIGNDAGNQIVRYFLEPGTTDLQRGVTQLDNTCQPTGSEAVQAVARTVRNAGQSPAVPVFAYYTGEGDEGVRLTPPISNFSRVARINIHLVIDVNERQYPPAVKIQTDVALRSSMCGEGTCGLLACQAQPVTALPLYDYADNKFVDEALAACKAYCPTNDNLPAGQCCGWSTAFDWSQVYAGAGTVAAICSCQASANPPITEPPPQVIAYTPNGSAYTDYVKACVGGSICPGAKKGTPDCAPGCLDPTMPGQCSCDCSG